MRGPLTYDDIADRESRAAVAGSDGHRRAAADLQAWAGQVHPGDDAEAGRGQLMVSAAGQLTLAGDHEAALGLLREAVASGDHVFPDARAHLVSGLVDCGLLEEAEKLADTLRRERPADPMVHLVVGEVFEAAERLDLALRWFTTGMLRAERADEDEGGEDSVDALLLMSARFRVRDRMGFPPDDYDLVAEAALEAAGGALGAD